MTPHNPHDAHDAPAAAPEGSGAAQAGVIASGLRLVGVSTLLSRVLGLSRDMAMAALFGAGPLMDAFTVAFRVPNLVRHVLGEGAFTAAFLPVFVREHERGGITAANRLMTAGGIALGGVLLVAVALAELALLVISLLVPMGPDARLLVILTAQMLPYTVLICLVAQLSAVLQSLGRYGWPAFVPVVLNVIWIAAIVVVSLIGDDPRQQMQWIAGSVVLAGVFQLGLISTVVHLVGLKFTCHWREAAAHVGEIVRGLLPVLVATSITQLNALFDSLLAWGLAAPADAPVEGFGWPLETGTASALYFAQRMYQFPLGVFGIALGTVLFPLLARHGERGEWEQVGRDLTLGIRLTLAIGIPASVGLILLREPIAAVFFERGAFTSENSALTARCIAAYAAGVWAYIGLLLIHRGFFAMGDRRTPTRIGMMTVGVNIALSLTLLWFLAGAGLALATALAAMVQFVATAAAYQRRTGLIDLHAVAKAAGTTSIATAVMSIVCIAVLTVAPPSVSTLDRLILLLAALAVSIAAFLITAKLIGLEEPFLLFRAQRPHRGR